MGKRKPYLIVGWLWYVITLVPVIGLVQVGNQAMADRYTYIPLLGIFIIVAWGIPDLFPRAQEAEKPRQERKRRCPARPEPVASKPARTDLAIPAALLIVILITCTYIQVSYWQNSLTLFSHTLSIFPNDAAARVIVADAYQQKGMDDEAIEQYRKAMQIDTRLTDARLNLGVLLAKHGLSDEAIQEFQELLRQKPDIAKGHYNLGLLLLQKGDLQKAESHFREAIRLDPTPQSYYNLGVALQNSGRNKEAIELYQQAVKLKPDYVEAHENLAIAYYADERYANAWREVQISRSYGGKPNTNFLQALSEKMPEPGL
jgi:protein O-mannosyl-transferase